MTEAHAGLFAKRYRMGSLLGQGGMGRVWSARDELLVRDVAIKELVLPQGLPEIEQQVLRERMIREARAIARLDHPHVVQIFDVLHDGGEPWIVMELIPSRSLSEVVTVDGPLPPAVVAEIGLDLLAALRAAHQAGLLHRDIKPGNVLLGDDGRVVLTDFGLATAAGDSSMTSTGVVLGTPSYLAPEWALDEPIGPPADLWSLGATLYTAVEGRPPYARSSPIATLAALATEPPRPSQQAGPLTPALNGLLQKNPAHRADADTAERLLRQALSAEPSRKRGKSAAVRAAVLVAAAVVVTLLAAVALRPLSDDRTADAKPVLAPSVTSTPVQSSATGRRVENRKTGTCLSIRDGSLLRLWTCDDSEGQRFTLAEDGTLRVLGRCVQAIGDDRGSRVFLTGCIGSLPQTFTYTKESLVAAFGGKCMTAPAGEGGDDGGFAELEPCEGIKSQKWRH